MSCHGRTPTTAPQDLHCTAVIFASSTASGWRRLISRPFISNSPLEQSFRGHLASGIGHLIGEVAEPIPVRGRERGETTCLPQALLSEGTGRRKRPSAPPVQR